jgi:hypothetical protein
VLHEPTSWWLGLAAEITAAGAAIGALLKGLRWVLRTWRKLSEFLDEWNGEAARPGHVRVPGIPERLTKLESDVTAVRAQVTPNGGSSLLDKVQDIKNAMEGTP